MKTAARHGRHVANRGTGHRRGRLGEISDDEAEALLAEMNIPDQEHET